MNPELQERLSAWLDRRDSLPAEIDGMREELREELRAIVDEAGEEGWPAAAVARELGMTRQSLRERLK